MLKIKTRGNLKEKNPSIIRAILDADLDVVDHIINNDPVQINAEEGVSGMNAPMLAASGFLPDILKILILKAGGYLDFYHRARNGDDLLDVGLSTMNAEIFDEIQAAYEKHARHILNNWPSP